MDYIHVFIDASNLWQAQKAKGMLFDFAKLKNFLIDTYNTKHIKIFYYTAYPKDGTRDYSLDSKHKFFIYLSKALNFEVRKKELKRIRQDNLVGEVFKEKGNMDVEMTIDVIHFINDYSTAIFFSGDSDFLPLVSYIRNKNKKVFIYSTKNNVSEELRTGADGYFDLLEIDYDFWGKKLSHRDAK